MTLLRSGLAACVLALAAGAAQADAVDTLRAFVRDVKTGRADFTQTVTSPDGAKKKTSTGRFGFARPTRFRFEYVKPVEQLIVGDGRKVWIHEPDLQQASSRRLDQAIGGTPAALLAGGSRERDFDLAALPERDDTERLPCFTTGTPQAAASSDAPVEILRLPEPSPPVPTTSAAARPAGSSTRRASWRMPPAKPRSSPAVSPLARNAASTAPETAGARASSASACSSRAASSSSSARRPRGFPSAALTAWLMPAAGPGNWP